MRHLKDNFFSPTLFFTTKAILLVWYNPLVNAYYLTTLKINTSLNTKTSSKDYQRGLILSMSLLKKCCRDFLTIIQCYIIARNFYASTWNFSILKIQFSNKIVSRRVFIYFYEQPIELSLDKLVVRWRKIHSQRSTLL